MFPGLLPGLVQQGEFAFASDKFGRREPDDLINVHPKASGNNRRDLRDEPAEFLLAGELVVDVVGALDNLAVGSLESGQFRGLREFVFSRRVADMFVLREEDVHRNAHLPRDVKLHLGDEQRGAKASGTLGSTP